MESLSFGDSFPGEWYSWSEFRRTGGRGLGAPKNCEGVGLRKGVSRAVRLTLHYACHTQALLQRVSQISSHCMHRDHIAYVVLCVSLLLLFSAIFLVLVHVYVRNCHCVGARKV